MVTKTDPTLGGKGISLFVVESETPGFKRGTNLKKMGLPAADTSELYFDEDQPTPLYSIDNNERVIKMGTFSKIISTGIRVGWIQANEDLIKAFSQTRFDMGNSPLIQRALSLYISEGLLEPHVSVVRNIYKDKMEALTTNLIKNCDPYVEFYKPRGGFFLWVKIKGVTNKELTTEASNDGVMFQLSLIHI